MADTTKPEESTPKSETKLIAESLMAQPILEKCQLFDIMIERCTELGAPSLADKYTVMQQMLAFNEVENVLAPELNKMHQMRTRSKTSKRNIRRAQLERGLVDLFPYLPRAFKQEVVKGFADAKRKQ